MMVVPLGGTFKKGKKLLCNTSSQRGVRMCKRTSSADPKVSAEGGQGVPQALEQIPLQPVVTPRWSRRMPEGGCDPVGSLRWSRFAAGLMTLRGTHAGAVSEEMQPVGRTHSGEVHGGLYPMGGSPHGSRENVTQHLMN